MKHNEQSGISESEDCRGIRDLLYLYSCNELESDEHDLVTAHLTNCEECRSALAEHDVLKQSLPSGLVDRKLFYYSENN